MRTGCCKHFNGIQNNTCDAGVCYNDVTIDPDKPGRALRIPCMSEFRSGKKLDGEPAKCDKYQEPTKDEIAAFDAVIQAAVDRMTKCGPWIGRMKKAHPNGVSVAADTCPICGGIIRFGISSYNGHMRARCDTPDCINFIE